MMKGFDTKLILILMLFLGSTALSFAQCEECEYLENLVFNGDFQLGPLGYTSDYTLSFNNGPWGLLSNEGTYGVSPDANFLHSNFQGLDHTNPSTGNFMVVNGSSIPNTNVWCQTIDVEPGTTYTITSWVQNVDTNPQNSIYGNLEFQIDGVSQGTPILADGGWVEMTFEWDSGTNETIELCILSLQTEVGGNDFGIDDISVTTCKAYNVIQQASAGEDLTVCSGEPFSIGAPSLTNFNYEWTSESVAVSIDGEPALLLENLTAVPYEITYELLADSANTGCFQFDEVTVTVNPNPIFGLSEDLVICEGETTLLGAGNGWEEVLWSTDETTNSIEVSEAGTYEATVTLFGCTASDEITVDIPILPAFSLGPDVAICTDEVAEFEVNVDGLWSDNETDFNFESSSEGWIWFEVEDQACTKRDSVFVDVIAYPVAEIESYILLCPGETYTYEIPQEGVWNNSITSDYLTVDESGFYTVSIANEQCAIFLESEVVYLQLPEVNLGPDQLLCIKDVVDLDASGTYNDSLVWNDGSVEFEREITTTGIYEVITWNQCGEAQDEVELIFDDCDYALFIPNAFTPDGDGINEVWLPIGLNISEYEIQVFNRWGESVWRSTQLGEAWSGSDNFGEYYVSDGIYGYKVKAISVKGLPITKFGSVLILR
ncbi:MAG: gliding motility-associated-like protein [Flavobacteriales bacterium]|jgi:gliding motility-associated-like protein